MTGERLPTLPDAQIQLARAKCAVAEHDRRGKGSWVLAGTLIVKSVDCLVVPASVTFREICNGDVGQLPGTFVGGLTWQLFLDAREMAAAVAVGSKKCCFLRDRVSLIIISTKTQRGPIPHTPCSSHIATHPKWNQDAGATNGELVKSSKTPFILALDAMT